MENTIFITIRPEGFIVNGQFKKELAFTVITESQARKLWTEANGKKQLACFSSNGRKSYKGKSCNMCSDLDDCQLKLRLLFNLNFKDYCLELPKTSYENYRRYTTKLLEDGFNVKVIITTAYVIDRGYWGEVCFSLQSNHQS